jgi:hypothetical protein
VGPLIETALAGYLVVGTGDGRSAVTYGALMQTPETCCLQDAPRRQRLYLADPLLHPRGSQVHALDQNCKRRVTELRGRLPGDE